jgi:hypothetical protein
MGHKWPEWVKKKVPKELPKEAKMYLYQVSYLRRAIRSLTTCTAPSVQVGRIVADADRLNSPFRGRHEVTYRVLQNGPAEPLIAAWNGRYHLWIGEARPPQPPEPLKGLVHDWVLLEVPRLLLQPLLDLAERLGLGRVDLPEIFYVSLAMPRLAGFQEGKPVFQAADAEDVADAE